MPEHHKASTKQFMGSVLACQHTRCGRGPSVTRSIPSDGCFKAPRWKDPGGPPDHRPCGPRQLGMAVRRSSASPTACVEVGWAPTSGGRSPSTALVEKLPRNRHAKIPCVKQNFLGIPIEIAYHQREATPPAAGPGAFRAALPTWIEVFATWIPGVFPHPAKEEAGVVVTVPDDRLEPRRSSLGDDEGISPRTFFGRSPRCDSTWA